MTAKNWLLIIFIAVAGNTAYSQQQVLYKQIDTTRLYMDVFPVKKGEPMQKCPAIIFFFGGGWINGDRTQFLHQAQYFSKRGAVCFLADYRTQANHATPFECVADAKSAVRYIRKHAVDFNIDPDRIVASGGSAGGQLAAATALIDDYNDKQDDTSVSCRPNALVLFNPVIDNGPGGYGYERIGNEYKKFSPLHNLRKGAPPTIFFLGTRDKLVPVVTAEYYKMVMEKLGSRCELKLYEGQAHGFFNYKNFDYYSATLTASDLFLQSIGFLTPGPSVEFQ